MCGGTSSKSCCWYETEDGVQREGVDWGDAVVDRCETHVEVHVRNLGDGMMAHGVANAEDDHGAVEARHMGHRLGHLVQRQAHPVDE